MKKFFVKYFIFMVVFCLTLGLSSVAVLIHHKNIGPAKDTVALIKKTQRLRLITTNALNTCYYYEGRRTGFEYDLAKAFADYLNVELDIVTPGWNAMFDYLNEDKGDFIAAGLTITPQRLAQVNFSIPYMTIQQRVIHHSLIFGPKSIEDMEFRTFHVRRGTSYQSRLAEIKASGVDLNYILHDNTATSELISMVQNRDIKFTVADAHIALLNKRYYPQIKIGIPIQKKESLAWAVRKNDTAMLEKINTFFLYAQEKGILKKITEKYYDNIKDFNTYELIKFHTRVKTRLPTYQAIIEQESKKYGFDWRLMAAVIYQESNFNPNAKSVTNVRGLMQVTQATAKEMGISNRLNPQQSIQAGMQYLNQMYHRFDYIEDNYQRMLFALASYNIGYGHVRDAIKLAQNQGLDPESWQSMKTVLPLLSKKAYYKKTKYGYARGWEPVQYVANILTYFEILKQIAKS